MRLLDGACCVAFFLLALTPSCAAGRDADSGPTDTRDRIRELEAQNAQLRTEVETLEARLRQIVQSIVCDISVSVCPSYPPIDATVVDREDDEIVLDKGERDGVAVGYVFDVYLGAAYKGRAEVTEVQERTCTCMILSERSRMAQGDSATTQL